MHRCASLILLFGMASLANAVTLQVLTMDDLSQKSSAIVYARVVDSYGALQGSMIYTHYRVQVIQTWKGGKQPITEIMLPGGVASGYRQTFAGVPALGIGKSYLMFLWSEIAGAPQLMGLTQGLFDVGADSTGALVASRPMTTEQLLDAEGKPVRDQAVQLPLTEINRRVKSAIAAGKARQ